MSIGLDVGEYSTLLGDARVAYDRLFDGPDLGSSCFDPAIGLEESRNVHIKTYTLWNECIQDFGCEFSEGTTNDRAHANWVRASRFSGRAQDEPSEDRAEVMKVWASAGQRP